MKASYIWLKHPHYTNIMQHSLLAYCVYPTLGTHNIQNISVIATSDGIQIEGHYTDNSGARELLVIMYNMHDPVPQYYLIPRHEGSPKRRKLHYRLNVDAGEWSVSIFVVENNQLPFSHVATPPVTVFIPNSSSKLPYYFNDLLTVRLMSSNLCIIPVLQVKCPRNPSSTAFRTPQNVS